MGKKNNLICAYFGKSGVFAELFNVGVCKGRTVITPEKLADVQMAYHEVMRDMERRDADAGNDRYVRS